MKTIIVDDEPRAHRILENYISRIPDLLLIGKFTNAIEAIDFMKSSEVNLILLDITMPLVDGFSFLRMQSKVPLVIFTTAHSEYALESYEYNAVDYLKKPIPFERFEKAIHKALKALHTTQEKIVPETIDLKIDGELRTISFNDILYFQSLGNYIKVHTLGKILLTQITTHQIEEGLPKELFLRIHKSYIVNRSKIDKITEEEIFIDKNKLPIGKTFKKYVKSSI